MNYRHAFHAGNFADVMKHAVLARILVHLSAKSAPWHYFDTHAGLGVYDFSAGEAERTGEWRYGIGRLRDAALSPTLAAWLAPYLAAVADTAPLYPGSPEIARRLARETDRLTLCELHPEDGEALDGLYRRDRRVGVVRGDGWGAMNGYLPPAERRGVVLVDPPFEEAGEIHRMRVAIERVHRKWPTGTYALWYPVKDPLEVDAFARDLGRAGIPKILRVELRVARHRVGGPLSAAGLIVINPPWVLAAELEAFLPELARHLGRDDGARARIDWIAGES
jgi:23S rRNA (adenine2030-N6)-methyltransferase